MDNLPSDRLFLASFTCCPAAKNASGSNGVSSSGSSSVIPKADVTFFRKEPSPIVNLSGSLILFSVNLATAVSNATAFSQMVPDSELPLRAVGADLVGK